MNYIKFIFFFANDGSCMLDPIMSIKCVWVKHVLPPRHTEEVKKYILLPCECMRIPLSRSETSPNARYAFLRRRQQQTRAVNFISILQNSWSTTMTVMGEVYKLSFIRRWIMIHVGANCDSDSTVGSHSNCNIHFHGTADYKIMKCEKCKKNRTIIIY